jgi:signal transduction histidine kinase
VVEIVILVAACAAGLACGAQLSLRPGVLAAAAIAAALAFAGVEIIPLLLLTVAPWSAGRLVRSRRELVAELAESNRRLEAEREALAALAVRRERARIARELHDIVAHHLAVMVIQAGAGRLAAPDSGARFAGIRDAGNEALGELERLVALLQTDDGDGRPRALDALLGQAESAGLRLDYEPLPEGVRVAPAVEDGAYRVIQEALTNAMKHAAGSVVRVRLAVRAGALEIDVRDDGAVAPSPLAATGLGVGLAGMRERVEALGGVLDAGPGSDGGWRLQARLPLG